MFNNLSRKKCAALALGAVMTVGAAFPVLSEVANANEAMTPPVQQKMQQSPKEGHYGHHQGGPRMFFPGIEQQLGISKADIDKYCKDGTRPDDVVAAALIAKAGNSSLDKVMSYKTGDNSWKEVMEKTGVTFEQVRQTRDELAANVIAQKTGANKNAIGVLFKQGYHDRDIMMAAELAKLSSKEVNEVINMKKINNSWHDVAQSLGVDDSAVREDMMPIQHKAK